MLNAKAKRRLRDYVRRKLPKLAKAIRVNATSNWELELANDLEKPHRGPYERYDLLSEAEVERGHFLRHRGARTATDSTRHIPTYR